MDNLNQSGQRVVEIDDANPISLLKNPEKFKDAFYEMTSLASQSLKAQQYDKSLKTLTKCLDMLDTQLGKNILKDASKYWKICIYGNLACAYQGTWKMQKCNKFCQKIEEQLQKLLESADCKQNYLNITKHLIRIKFQHCAILSQLSQHDKALQMCQSTLPTLKNYISAILDYTQSLKANRSQKKSSQTVHFSKHVCAFAEQILTNLLNCLKEPLKLNIDKSSFYYWQKNPQNNEKQVQKKFVSPRSNDTCKRSILGVNKIAHWIDQFNIGTIMHMSELSISDFEQTLPIQQYLFRDKLYQAVIHCSIANFTIATEMRFIESNKQKQKSSIHNESQQQVSQQSTINSIHNINKKYGYQQKSQIFQISQLYHLRAINIMAQNIKTTVPYISHLIKSYDKHYIYKKQLDPVIAIAQQSLMSISETNQMSINKKQFTNSNILKGSNRYVNAEQNIFTENCAISSQQDHYFTNINQQNVGNINISANGHSVYKQQQRNNTETMHILDELKQDDDFKIDLNTQKQAKKSYKKDKRGLKSSITKNNEEKQLEKSISEDDDQQQVKMVPNYINTQRSRHHSTKKTHRNKSGIKTKPRKQSSKSLRKDEQVKGLKKKQKAGNQKQKKKKLEETEKQFRIKHQTCTQIKVVYKKKK